MLGARPDFCATMGLVLFHHLAHILMTAGDHVPIAALNHLRLFWFPWGTSSQLLGEAFSRPMDNKGEFCTGAILKPVLRINGKFLSTIRWSS
jgi:hypothetical protein